MTGALADACSNPSSSELESGGRFKKENAGSSTAGKVIRMAASLALCLQFLLAVYATFLSAGLDPQYNWWSANKQWRRSMGQASNPVCEVEQPKKTLEQSKKTLEQSKETLEQSKDVRTLRTEVYKEIVRFQRDSVTLQDLLRLPSSSSSSSSSSCSSHSRVTVVILKHHFKLKNGLCAQLDALLKQTLPFHIVWVIALGDPNYLSLRSIVDSYNNSRIFFIGSTYDLKYHGRFQLALEAEGADFFYIVDDDMIPGRKVLEIFSHAAGTEKYRNAVLGSTGHIFPFPQKDFSFPTYRRFGSKASGFYLPDPTYSITVDRVLQVDFLSSAWFLSSDLLKTLFIENPFTFATGEDMHLSYLLQKHRGAGSFVLPVDPKDKDTWADSENRLAYVSDTTLIFKDVVEVQDKQWWQYMSRGYVTQWARMYPQQSDVLFYAHTLGEIIDLAPLILRFRNTIGRKAYVAVSGRSQCSCEEASVVLGWSQTACNERRFNIFDLAVGSGGSNVHTTKEIYSSMKGLLAIHNPSAIITVADLDPAALDGLALAVARTSSIALIHLPRVSVPHVSWMADVKPAALKKWNRMKISVNIVTQNRATSLRRLLDSLTKSYYVGDGVVLTFNMDSGVDAETVKIVDSFIWPHGDKIIRRRIIQGGLIRAVTESWYPSSDDDYGVVLEDDIEVSPYYYMWLKYALLAYRYDPQVSLPELNAIALYTPRLIEVVKERPKWNATQFFEAVHPNTPYLHQLPCSWGSLFFPQKWREFYKYMNMRFTEDAMQSPVQIPRSTTNGWQASWKKFLIDVMYLRGYVTLYPNFPDQRSFSTNHMEPGAHISAAYNFFTHKKEDFEVPLLQEDFCKLLPQQKMPPLSALPVINLFNQITTLEGLKAAGSKLHKDVMECNLTQVVKVDDITGEPLNCVTY